MLEEMSERSKDELIEAQKEVIGILFEIIKRLQANNELDEEYFNLISNVQERDINQKRLDQILKEREENGKIVTRLLEKLEI
ncbi:MAG: hydrolase [Nitrosopumilaceae archaeon]